MCRLLAYAASRAVSPRDLLGGSIEDFRRLSAVHRDGWGAAWLDESGSVQLDKAPEPGLESPAFAARLDALRSRAAIVHLRWATGGLPVCLPNTHPFRFEGVAFAHNGGVDKEFVRRLVAPAYLRDLEGTTDSELYFRALLSAMTETGDAFEAFARVVRAIRREGEHTGLNFLLLTPRALYAACAFHPRSKILETDPDYYVLRYRVEPDAVLVASSGWAEADAWPALPNGRAIAVDLATLDVKEADIA
ncbi:MAG: class II glutamine amidotransferase [Firmicutes bacterium]|nr:class II glutamine amidotransferase [Bacillota bacterium]